MLKEAKTIQKELVAARRYLHRNAEVGFALPKTTAFLKGELEKLGCAVKACGRAGLVTTVGNEGKTLLLRADTDALPIQERSGESFASKNGNMHACGHDLHATMLLGAAKLLKAREKELKGRVKLLFQPAEELLEGAKNTLEHGVLKAPSVDAAMMVHVTTGTPLAVGTAVVASAGVSAPAADHFTVEVRGKGCHGSAPWNGIDALSAAAHIALALQEISAREISIAEPAVLTVGSFSAGTAGNAIADKAVLKGTLRAFDEEVRASVKKRLETVCEKVAQAFRAKAKVVYGGGCPTLVNDGEISAFAERALKGLLGEGAVFTSAGLSGGVKAKSGGSEDFAYIAREVPSVMVAVAAGEAGNGYEYPLHHPKVKFDEEALAVGCAVYAHTALEWLKAQGER